MTQGDRNGAHSTTETILGQFCGLCGEYLRDADAGRCGACGAATRYELTDRAREWIAEREREIAECEIHWQALTAQQRLALQSKLETGRRR